MADFTNEDILLRDNDEQLSHLAEKTSALKNASSSLGQKVSASTTDTQETSIDMSNLVEWSNTSIESVSRLVNTRFTYRHCCILTAAVLIFLIIVYGLVFKFEWTTTVLPDTPVKTGGIN